MWSLCLLLALAAARIGLVEEHNHVLVHLMNATKHGLPASNVTLIHFDSHADMAVSGYFPSSIMSAFDTHPENIVTATKIENWVTASWLLGIVDRMIFIEPPWGGEFRGLPHRELIYFAGTVEGAFKVDIQTLDGKRVSSEYWHTVDDHTLPDPLSHFADHTTMSDKRKIEVLIVPFEELFTTVVDFVQKTPSAALVLDIDLDCFSTESPGHLNFFRQSGVPLRFQELAADMYHQRSPPFAETRSFTIDWWQDNLARWDEHCPELLSVFDVARQRDSDGIRAPAAIIPARPVPDHVDNVDPEGLVARLYDQSDLFGAGNPDEPVRSYVVGLLQTFTDSLSHMVEQYGMEETSEMMSRALQMPIHLGTEDEITVMIGAIECVLKQLKGLGRTPSLVTLARSPMYTPVHHLKSIECGVLEMLLRQYPDIRDIYHENGLSEDYAS